MQLWDGVEWGGGVHQQEVAPHEALLAEGMVLLLEEAFQQAAHLQHHSKCPNNHPPLTIIIPTEILFFSA